MKKQSAETNEQAWAAWNAEAIKLINQAGDFFHDEIDPRLWQDALRFGALSPPWLPRSPQLSAALQSRHAARLRRRPVG